MKKEKLSKKNGKPTSLKNKKVSEKVTKSKAVTSPKKEDQPSFEVNEKKKRGRPAGSKNMKHKKRNTKTKKDQPKKEIILKKTIKSDMNIEIWPVNKEVYKIYVENKEFAEKLSKTLKTNICATYMTKQGKEFGWDLFFNKPDLKYVNQMCKKVA